MVDGQEKRVRRRGWVARIGIAAAFCIGVAVGAVGMLVVVGVIALGARQQRAVNSPRMWQYVDRPGESFSPGVPGYRLTVDLAGALVRFRIEDGLETVAAGDVGSDAMRWFFFWEAEGRAPDERVVRLWIYSGDVGLSYVPLDGATASRAEWRVPGDGGPALPEGLRHHLGPRYAERFDE